MIGGVAVVLPFGKLYGLFNVKYLYIISVFLFMVGSALCGAAPTMNAFIVGRVLAGMGGNGMYFGVMTILSVNTSNKERPPYLALWYVDPSNETLCNSSSNSISNLSPGLTNEAVDLFSVLEWF